MSRPKGRPRLGRSFLQPCPSSRPVQSNLGSSQGWHFPRPSTFLITPPGHTSLAAKWLLQGPLNIPSYTSLFLYQIWASWIKYTYIFPVYPALSIYHFTFSCTQHMSTACLRAKSVSLNNLACNKPHAVPPTMLSLISDSHSSQVWASSFDVVTDWSPSFPSC